MSKKLLDFKASISDVKQINPLFSTCRIRILYTGRNRNLSIITRDSVEKALPTLAGIPIVGEYSVENKDFKGHGGAIDLDSYKYIHTTKPYGFVPESATYSWEEVRGADGATREYLVIDGCYLWTGRYEEAYSIIEDGKGQSMEIEVTDGFWNEEEEAYQIDNFIFSGLCILGDDVEPAFEDANISRAYSLDKDSFKQEFSLMLSELKSSLSQEEEVSEMLKALLEKYSLTMEDITAKGIDLASLSEDELESKIIEVFEIEVQEDEEEEDKQEPTQTQEDEQTQVTQTQEDEEEEEEDKDPVQTQEDENQDPTNQEDTVDVGALQKEIEDLKSENQKIAELEQELETLREFKLNVEKKEHEDKVNKLFSDFQLTNEDVESINIHEFSVEEIEEKCFAILGRKMASQKNFSKNKDVNIRINLDTDNDENNEKPYGGLFDKYNK